MTRTARLRTARLFWLGEVLVPELPPSPRQSPVEIRYRLDISGLLHVSATHVPSGKSGEVTLRNSPSRLSQPQRRQIQKELDEIRASPSGSEAADVDPGERRLAESLLARAERVLEGGNLQAPGRAAITEARDRLRSALDENSDP